MIESRKDQINSKSDSGDALVTKTQKLDNDKKNDQKLRNKSECFECHKSEHFRRDCRKYKARIVKEQLQGKLIEANQTYSKSLMLTSISYNRLNNNH